MKYSVIIPVYNAEKTLQRCLQSLLSQNYNDAEIILINDGSRDGSDQLCRMYAEQNNQIVYISKENGGVSSARNAGLNAATGEYILFVDSDDYVSSHYFSAMDQISVEWDYVLFSYHITDGIQHTPHILAASETCGSDNYFSQLGELIYRKRMNCPWNKRYKRDLIEKHKIRFCEHLSLGEDALFNLQYAVCCASCFITNIPLYNVSIENDESLSRKSRKDLHEQLMKGEQDMLTTINGAVIEENDRRVLLSAMNFLRLSEIYSEAKRMHMNRVNIVKRIKTIRKMCDAFNRQTLSLPDSRYCKLLSVPVKLRLAVLIDLAGWKLTH